jgi:phosphoglycerol transferase
MTALRGWFRENLPELVAYAGVTLVAITIAVVVLDLRHADLAVPFSYGAFDAYEVDELFKNVQETGSIDTNPRLGAPLSTDFRNDPQMLYLPILSARFLFLFLHDYATVLNVYFLLSFPLTAALALYALRALGFSYVAAFVPAVLYAFLPYHLLRAEDHLLLSTYFLIPPVILVALWLAGGRALFHWQAGKKFPTVTREGAVAILVCVLLGSDHAYYAFFGLFLFLLAAAYAYVASGNRRRLADAAAAIGVTFLTLALNLSDYLIRRGTTLPLSRAPREGEFYVLKFIQLILPIPSHRIDAFAHFRHYYDATAPLVNENSSVSLGIVGSLGFLLLLAVLIFRFRARISDVVKQSAVLNFGCFLLATGGGLGSLFNYAVLPDIRSYNRIVVYVAFLSFIAVTWVLEKSRVRLTASRNGRSLGVAGLTLLLVLGIADQSSPAMVPDYAQNAAVYRSDRAFVQAIERSLPPAAAVFQLPHVPYPALPFLVPADFSPYWLFKGYLHSERLRWSYGAIRGGEDDAWLRSLAALQPAQLLPKLVLAGFEGIYIDRRAYNDQHAERALEAALSKAMRETPLESTSWRSIRSTIFAGPRLLASPPPDSTGPAR